jgi:hypothetical protein
MPYHNFMIPDITLRPEGFHLCSEQGYDFSTASQTRHANILKFLSQIPKETTVVDGDKKDGEEEEQGKPWHPFLHVDHSLRPEGFHLISERYYGRQLRS